MTDPWWWATLGAAVGTGGALPALFRLLGRFVRPARKSDADVAADLRDALLGEIARLRDRVDRVEERADALQRKLMECEERSAEMERELDLRAGYAVERERRISALTDRVARLEARG